MNIIILERWSILDVSSVVLFYFGLVSRNINHVYYGESTMLCVSVNIIIEQDVDIIF